MMDFEYKAKALKRSRFGEKRAANGKRKGKLDSISPSTGRKDLNA